MNYIDPNDFKRVLRLALEKGCILSYSDEHISVNGDIIDEVLAEFNKREMDKQIYKVPSGYNKAYGDNRN